MGWLYMQSLGGHKGPRQYLDAQFTWESEHAQYKVLRSALVSFHTYYAAVEQRLKATGEHSVHAVICRVQYNKHGDRDGYVFGYKDMDESMGPYQHDCPAAILDLLTPTDNEYANNWRAQCRTRIAARKPKPKIGDIIVLAKPLHFTNGADLSRFEVVKDHFHLRRTTLRDTTSGGHYRITRLAERDYTIERKA